MCSSLLTDKPLVVAPGQLSMEGLLADLYRQSYQQTHAQLDRLPGLLATEQISLTTYQETDRCLCALLDTYAHFLAVLGFPQPQRPR